MTSAVPVGLVGLIIFSVVLLALDIRERIRTWSAEAGKVGLTWRGGLFLLAVLAVYSAIQFAGLALVPGVAKILEGVRALSGMPEPLAIAGGPAPWQTAVIVITAFYFLGLLDYLFHRFISHSRPLWFSHENHHLPRDLYVFMPGIAARPFVVIAAFPAVAGLVAVLHTVLTVLGVHGFDIVSLTLLLGLAQLFIASASHSAFLRRHWAVHRVMKVLGLTTPQEHWYHHVQELNVNYGNFTTVWDRVFGTYLDPVSVDADRFRAGLDYDQDFLGTLTLGKLKFGPTVRERYQLGLFCNLGED